MFPLSHSDLPSITAQVTPPPPFSPHPSPPSYSTPSFLLFQPPKPEDHRPDFSPTTEKSRPTRALRFFSFSSSTFHRVQHNFQPSTSPQLAQLSTKNNHRQQPPTPSRHQIQQSPTLLSRHLRPLWASPSSSPPLPPSRLPPSWALTPPPALARYLLPGGLAFLEPPFSIISARRVVFSLRHPAPKLSSLPEPPSTKYSSSRDPDTPELSLLFLPFFNFTSSTLRLSYADHRRDLCRRHKSLHWDHDIIPQTKQDSSTPPYLGWIKKFIASRLFIHLRLKTRASGFHHTNPTYRPHLLVGALFALQK
ncbi:fungal specific transcription factor domain-containing protein [Colletotrichum acutatum]